MDALIDVNLLLALLDPKHAVYQKVSKWFSGLPEGSRVLICRVAQQD